MDKTYSRVTFVSKFYTISVFRSSRGCGDVLFLNMKQSHEINCRFRPAPCQFASRGCEVVLCFKVEYNNNLFWDLLNFYASNTCLQDIKNHEQYCRCRTSFSKGSTSEVAKPQAPIKKKQLKSPRITGKAILDSPEITIEDCGQNPLDQSLLPNSDSDKVSPDLPERS